MIFRGITSLENLENMENMVHNKGITEDTCYADSTGPQPQIDISYSKDTKMLFIDVALPGYTKDILDISTIDNSIIISAEEPDSLLIDNPSVIYSQKQIFNKEFKTKIVLDTLYVGGEINAYFDNSILYITVKPVEKQQSKVTIK